MTSAKGAARITLTDGGMGQELLHRTGATPTPLWSAQALIDHPDVVRGLHLDFITAGARVITLNTYAATPERLAREGVGEMFDTLQDRAMDAAETARDEAGVSDVAIAGCLPPLFGSYQPELRLPFDETLEIYRRIVAQQAERVALILCETMASAVEGLAAATAACESGKPVWLSWTLADKGAPRLRSGETLAAAAEAVAHLPLAARMVNCSWPEAVDRALPELAALGGTVGAYANGFTAVEALKLGGTVDVLEARKDLGPDSYADFALGWVRQGAAIVGGCCEVGPEHIARLRDRLE
nr:homocysteine S-methyltransferase family protein [Rhizobiaceae bacterium]